MISRRTIWQSDEPTVTKRPCDRLNHAYLNRLDTGIPVAEKGQYMPPPISPIAPAPCCGCSGIIEMTASVVSKSEAMDAAF